MGLLTEKQEYIEKIDKQIICINGILKQGRTLLSAEQRDKLNSARKQAELLSGKLKNDEFEIAVVGLEKAGKSTFANALIESNLLPSEDERCTYTSTCVTYGEKPKAEITFFSKREFNENFQDNLKTLGFEDSDKCSYDTLTLKDFSAYIDRKEKMNNDEENLKRDIELILKDYIRIDSYLGTAGMVFDADRVESDELKKFIVNPTFALAVKNIRLCSDKLKKMKNAVIYDVPGFDSPTMLHEEQTKAHMRSADAVIMIANMQSPSLTGPQLKIFRDNADDDGTRFKDKLFVFGNRADQAKDLEKNKETLILDLHTRGVLDEKNDGRIVIGSAAAHLFSCGAVKEEYAKGAFSKLQEIGANTGIEEMHSLLVEYNDKNRFEVLKRRADKINTEIRDLLTDLKREYGRGAAGNSALDKKRTFRSFQVLEESKKKLKKT